MFAIYLLGYAVGYLLLAIVTTYVVVKRAGKRGAPKRTKIIAALVTLFIFWLIPFWDWLPTVLYHKYLCKTEAGVKIYRSAEGVEGFSSRVGALTIGGQLLAEELGYRYVDDMDLRGNIVRPRKNEKGKLPLVIFDPVTAPSPYGYKYEITRGFPWHAVKNTYTTYIIATGEVLGTFIDFGYIAADPNVSMSEWRKPWLNSYSCYEDGAQRARLEREMVLRTLKPLQAKN
jgi:hypothetical protein